MKKLFASRCFLRFATGAQGQPGAAWTKQNTRHQAWTYKITRHQRAMTKYVAILLLLSVPFFLTISA
jgi:hypothetical protein